MKKTLLSGILLIFSTISIISQTSQTEELHALAKRALEHNRELQIQQQEINKAKIDRQKAYSAYLPKVTAEAAYTYMNAPIEFPDELKTLLTKTQSLLIKEGIAQQTKGLINFATPGSTSVNGVTVDQMIQANLKPISSIQDQSFVKANISAQMLLFSGLKVPYTIKAANHQIAAKKYLNESKEADVIRQILDTYDQLAILAQSEQTLNQTETLLLEQKRFVDKALANGLTIQLNQQKIELAIEQLKVKRIELKSGKQLISMRINELTGMPIDSASMLSPIVQPWTQQQTEATADNRPEIKALNEAIIATDYKQKSEYTDYIPKVMAFGKKELIEESLTMLDPEWYVGIGVKWTLFDGLSARHNARQSAIDRDVLKLRRDETLQLANIKMEKDRLEIVKCNQLIETARKQMEMTASMVRLSTKQMEQGLITLNDHMMVINDYEKASLNLIKCVADQRKAVADYLQSTGLLTLENLQ